MEIVIIAAVAANGIIGADGELPWHYPEDLSHFKNKTITHSVIMGRKTYENIEDRLGEPLPERTNIVLSKGSREFPDEVIQVSSVDEALDFIQTNTDDCEAAYVIGGASIYDQFLPLADRMIITEIHDEYEGDTYFPEWDPNNWKELQRVEKDEFAFVEYVST